MMKKLTIGIVLGFLLMLLGLCSCRGGAQKSAMQHEIDSLVDSLFAANDPGAIIIVFQGDSVLYTRAVGKADVYTAQPLDTAVKMNVANTTKSFTCAAVMKLQQDGRLSLDDKLVKYYPQLPDSVFGEITLRHILSNSSGIPDLRPATPKQWERYQNGTHTVFGSRRDYRLYGREMEFTGFLAMLDSLDFKPGSGFEIQDPPFMLMLGVIEQASGMRFEDFMRDSIFAPAGITNAAFINQANTIPNVAHAYRPSTPETKKSKLSKDGRWEEFDYGEAEFFLTRADRGLFITAPDLMRWMQALYGGKILTAESLGQMLSPQVNMGLPDNDYGIGVKLRMDKGKLRKAYHGGERGGFIAYEAFFPQEKTGYIVLSNRNNWNYNTLARQIEQILFKYGLL